MDRFIVVDGNYEERIKVDFDYKLGETLTYNSDSQIKCIDIKIHDGEKLFIFKEGRKVFLYD